MTYSPSKNSFLDVCELSTKLRDLCPSRKSRIHIFFLCFSVFLQQNKDTFLDVHDSQDKYRIKTNIFLDGPLSRPSRNQNLRASTQTKFIVVFIKFN